MMRLRKLNLKIREMRTTKQYSIICPSCEGVGYVANREFNPNVTTSSISMVCPACNGSKVVIATRDKD
jgi:DnaJ-class molecular chaperone